MKWEPGRQGTGYEKLKIWSFWRTDCYLLRYRVGASIPQHIDPVEGRSHWRVNIRFPGAEGGELRFVRWINRPQGFMGFQALYGTFFLFRSDILPHYVTKVKSGTRYVLSFGVAI